MSSKLGDTLASFLGEEFVEGRVADDKGETALMLSYARRDNEFQFEIQRGYADDASSLRFRNQLVEAKTADDAWEPLEGAEDLRIYLLLDPRLFYPLADRAIEVGANRFKLEYKLRDISIPPFDRVQELPESIGALRDYAAMHEGFGKLSPDAEEVMLAAAQPLFRLLTESREVTFYVNDGRLSEMRQPDLPPHDDWITVAFTYRPDS